ncbi:hypothetical protein [Dechloromonas sp.]|uniref:hypothetical protein n=1 Tax=Dechloromonas sp. TaxID=1917218 RepID=UPI00263F865A|nr:hypothetical protein [Dechloromonas sp.]
MALVCVVLLNELNLIDKIKFVRPKDMQDGKIEITERDITTNPPYLATAHLSFDHHLSETLRNAGERENHIVQPDVPSAAADYNFDGLLDSETGRRCYGKTSATAVVGPAASVGQQCARCPLFNCRGRSMTACHLGLLPSPTPISQTEHPKLNGQ